VGCDEGYGPGGRRRGRCSGTGRADGGAEGGPREKVRPEGQSGGRPRQKRGQGDSCPPGSLPSSRLPPPPCRPAFPIPRELSEVTDSAVPSLLSLREPQMKEHPSYAPN